MKQSFTHTRAKQASSLSKFILFDDFYKPIKAQSVAVGNLPNAVQLLNLSTGVINEPGQRQFGSPYLALGNNPTLGVDPNGEFVFLFPL